MEEASVGLATTNTICMHISAADGVTLPVLPSDVGVHMTEVSSFLDANCLFLFHLTPAHTSKLCHEQKLVETGRRFNIALDLVANSRLSRNSLSPGPPILSLASQSVTMRVS